MATKQKHEFPRDVQPRYFVGGLWRAAQNDKRPSRTSSKPCRLYVAIPPKGGWPGGDPAQNGWKPSGGK